MTHMYYSIVHLPKAQKGIFSHGYVEHLAISFELYELDPSISSISVVLIHEMRVFTSSNTSVESGGMSALFLNGL